MQPSLVAPWEDAGFYLEWVVRLFDHFEHRSGIICLKHCCVRMYCSGVRAKRGGHCGRGA